MSRNRRQIAHGLAPQYDLMGGIFERAWRRQSALAPAIASHEGSKRQSDGYSEANPLKENDKKSLSGAGPNIHSAD